jgi:adenosylcobyric acid synthase
MVQGTSSWAGKSLIATVLCRHFARQGVRVAPFKAQNMSNNARVVDGGEIGTAQYLQAIAARVQPDVRMNPVLVKPETETTSQVIVRGRANTPLSRMEWHTRPPYLWAAIEESYTSLSQECELIVIEGAGSPAEINLRDSDLANMPIARLADAPVLLVSDIDRGGALAHLYGTWALLQHEDRSRIRAFILNRFRGERSLLEPAPSQLHELTGVPMLGVIPMLTHGLPDEDGAAAGQAPGNPNLKDPRVAIIRYPTASNLDEFKALEGVAQTVWAERPADLDQAELIILPGSKHVARDLSWLRTAGLEPLLRAHAASGKRLLGICGGLQMLGQRIEDHTGQDQHATGLGLIPIDTELLSAKHLAAQTYTRFRTLEHPWSDLSGRTITGYEIRHGHSTPQPTAHTALPDGLGWNQGPVLGIYLHGALENPELLHQIFGVRPARTLDAVIDDLTDAVIAALDEHLLNEIAGL